MKASDLFRRMHELSEAGEAFVVCTLLSSQGHAPQEAGAKALVTAAGLCAGSVGGGKLENKAIAEARALIENAPTEPNDSWFENKPAEQTGAAATSGQRENPHAPFLCDWDLQKDVGMSCGGRATLLFEVFGARVWNIAVFGAGHVSQALCRVLLPLNCRLTCVDTRAEWIERLPEAPHFTRRVVEDLAGFAADIPPGTFCTVITMGHGTDFPVLKVLLPRADLPFVGSIGSRVKARAMRADLGRAGLSAECIQKLHCPIGLNLGGRRPEEIAISIAAQLLLARDAPGTISRTAGLKPASD